MLPEERITAVKFPVPQRAYCQRMALFQRINHALTLTHQVNWLT